MKPSSDLFKLIKSLTKSEKRFFKLSSSLQSGDKNYLKLFDAIEKQSVYDESSIKEQFKDETFINHLPSEKNHLHRLILKSLRIYNGENSINSILQDSIKNIEILYEKALYAECSKILVKAKKTAYQHEKLYYLLELIKWEKFLLEEEFSYGNFTKDLNQLIEEEQEVIKKLQNMAEYQILFSKINYVFRRGGFSRTDSEKQIVNDISNHPLIKGKNTALSRRAAATCYYIKGLCATTNHQLDESFTNFTKVISIFEQHAHLLQDLPKHYIKSLRNLLYYYVVQGEFEKCEELLEKLRTLETNPNFASVDLHINILTAVFVTELQKHIKQQKFEESLLIIEELSQKLEPFKSKVSKEDDLLLNYYISYCYFGNQKFRSSIKWLNKVLNDNESNLRQDVYSIARLFSLVIHYELGNYELLEYKVKSTIRYFQKRKSVDSREHKIEILTLKYLAKLSKQKMRDESTQEIFEELKLQLVDITKDEYEKIALEYFDALNWVELKLLNQD